MATSTEALDAAGAMASPLDRMARLLEQRLEVDAADVARVRAERALADAARQGRFAGMPYAELTRLLAEACLREAG